MQKLKQLRHSRRGVSAVSALFTFIIVAVVLPLGIYTVAIVAASLPMPTIPSAYFTGTNSTVRALGATDEAHDYMIAIDNLETVNNAKYVSGDALMGLTLAFTNTTGGTWGLGIYLGSTVLYNQTTTSLTPTFAVSNALVIGNNPLVIYVQGHNVTVSNVNFTLTADPTWQKMASGYGATKSTTASAITLFSVSPIVVAAGGLLAVLVVALGVFLRRGKE